VGQTIMEKLTMKNLAQYIRQGMSVADAVEKVRSDAQPAPVIESTDAGPDEAPKVTKKKGSSSWNISRGAGA
jgi:hypothetical protein